MKLGLNTPQIQNLEEEEIIAEDYEFSYFPGEEGESSGSIVITYDDAAQTAQEISIANGFYIAVDSDGTVENIDTVKANIENINKNEYDDWTLLEYTSFPTEDDFDIEPNFGYNNLIANNLNSFANKNAAQIAFLNFKIAIPIPAEVAAPLGEPQDLCVLISPFDNSTNKFQIVSIANAYLNAFESSAKLAFPIVRTITFPITVQLTATPYTNINVYDDAFNGFPHGMPPTAIPALGNLLEPQRLKTTINRYRETSDLNPLKDLNTVQTGKNSEVISGPFVNSITTILTTNRQFTVKVTYNSTNIPPAPWNNPNNTITATAIVAFEGIKVTGTNDANLDSLSLYNHPSHTLSATGISTNLSTLTILDNTYYVITWTFRFDITNAAIVLSDEAKTALGIAEGTTPTVSDVMFTSLTDPLEAYKTRSVMFSLKSIKFNSPGRVPSRSIKGIKSGNLMHIPTIEGALFPVGDQQYTRLFMLNPELNNGGSEYKGVIDYSLKEEVPVPPPNQLLFNWDFKMQQLATELKMASSNYKTILVFDYLEGAIKPNGVHAYLGATKTVTLTYSISIDVSFDLQNTDLQFSDIVLKLYKNFETDFKEELTLQSPVITTETGEIAGETATLKNFNWEGSKIFTLSGSSSLNVIETLNFVVGIPILSYYQVREGSYVTLEDYTGPPISGLPAPGTEFTNLPPVTIPHSTYNY